MPKISVLTPSYNTGKYLKEAIESVLTQTYQDFEVIIIDDGSTDDTQSIALEFEKKYPDKVRYVYQENKGLAIARNTGIKASKGEYIALLDADDIWKNNRLEEGVKILSEQKDIGLVHAGITWISETKKILTKSKREIKYLSGSIFNHIFLRKAHVSCPTVLVRKSCFDEVGLFDENLTRLGCEDREMWLRIAKNTNFFFINKELAFYRVVTGSMSKNMGKMLKARLYVINKFFPPKVQIQPLRQKALAKIYRDMGDHFLYEHQFKEARNQYLKALKSWPFSFWAIINLFKAIFNIKVR